MYAFRAAFRERDASESIDEVNSAGERVIAGRRTSPRSAVSNVTLRQELADDLGSLLNTVNFAAAEDIAAFDHVQRSILNYGVADLTAISSDSQMINELSGALATVLQSYEQRLIPGSIHAKLEHSADDASGHIRFHVTADMHSTPADIPVEFVADIEADGKMKVSRF